MWNSIGRWILIKFYYLFDRLVYFYTTANWKTKAEVPQIELFSQRWEEKWAVGSQNYICIIHYPSVINNFSSGPSVGSLRGKDTYPKCYFVKISAWLKLNESHSCRSKYSCCFSFGSRLHYDSMETNFCQYYNISLQGQCNSHQCGNPKQPLQLGNHYLIREKHQFTKQAS